MSKPPRSSDNSASLRLILQRYLCSGTAQDGHQMSYEHTLVTCIRVVQCPVDVLTVAHVLSRETHSAEEESKVPVVTSITRALWLPAGLVIPTPMIPHGPSSFQTLPEPRPLSRVICLAHHLAHRHVAHVNSQPSGFSINVTHLQRSQS